MSSDATSSLPNAHHIYFHELCIWFQFHFRRPSFSFICFTCIQSRTDFLFLFILHRDNFIFKYVIFDYNNFDLYATAVENEQSERSEVKKEEEEEEDGIEIKNQEPEKKTVYLTSRVKKMLSSQYIYEYAVTLLLFSAIIATRKNEIKRRNREKKSESYTLMRHNMCTYSKYQRQ